ncbi:MAG: thiamine diphosphokinase [Clostridiales bacterium]|nr:thiamine diphosphokinase [Clostridiales bacterium]
MKTCLIVSGGSLEPDFAAGFLEKTKIDKIIAVDGGLAYLDALGRVPDYIVGDFDTIDETVTERYRSYPYIVWERHKPEKNETDTELARSLVLTLGCGEIIFLGALGGRVDHMLANIHTLYACLQSGVKASLIDRRNRIYLLDEGKTFRRGEVWGKYISFLPYTEEVGGICLKGFRYPLVDRTIRRGEEAGLCISNELAEDTAVLTFDSGVLVCVESHD